MSTKTTVIRARIEPELKDDVESVLNELGLSVTDAITIFFRQIRRKRKLPFDVRIPNRTTRKTLEKSERNEEIIYFKDVDDMTRNMLA